MRICAGLPANIPLQWVGREAIFYGTKVYFNHSPSEYPVDDHIRTESEKED